MEKNSNKHNCPLTYICLDIETTGFEKETDQIIEVAMVKVEDGIIVDRFESLVHAEGAVIPDIITHITGIKSEDLENAPSLLSLKNTIINFIGDFPIMGHNIQFDTGFLKAKGLEFTNNEWDTFPLCTMVLEKAGSFSLETLAKRFNIHHEDAHRAMADVLANVDVFHVLWEELLNLPKHVVSQICDVAEKSSWGMKDLFFGLLPFTKDIVSKVKNAHEEYEERSSNNVYSSYEEVFEENGELGNSVNNYRFRKAQLAMAKEIDANFTNKTHLLCEAPTGTGKTFGYLVPALNSGKQVIISTATRALQDQIIYKDIPVLEKLFPGKNVCVLKGRSNYICEQRFSNFLQKHSFTNLEVIVICKILIWLEKTETGDKEELELYREEVFFFEEYFSANKFYTDEKTHEGFFQKQREKALRADILIVNHALLFSDAQNVSHNILPKSDYLILDEAHKIEDMLGRSLEKTLHIKRIENILKAVKHLIDESHDAFGDHVRDVDNSLNLFLDNIGMYFGVWTLFANEFLNPDYMKTTVLIDNSIKVREDFKNIQESTNTIVLQWEKVKTLFERKLGSITSFFVEEITTKISDIEEFFQTLSSIVFQEHGENTIAYFSIDQNENVKIHFTLNDVGLFFQEHIIAHKKSVILTSATMSDYHGKESKEGATDFHYMRKMLHLEDTFYEVVLPYPFDLKKQVKVILPKDLPGPAQVGNFKKTSEIYFDIFRTLKGRVLGLFTSYKALEGIFNNLASTFKAQGINILGQRMSGGNGKILHAYAHDPDHTIVLGTKMYFEGVDFKENPLKCVCIHRLPFDPVKDPVIEKRMEKFKNPFMEYTLARAIINFKQGVGRLIRSEDSKGTIVVLDSRIVEKRYGKNFLEMFPEEIIHVVDSHEVCEYVK